MADDDRGNQTEKITLTLGVESLEWVRETYPDALGDQEALRMAIKDARAFNESQGDSGSSE